MLRIFMSNLRKFSVYEFNLFLGYAVTDRQKKKIEEK